MLKVYIIILTIFSTCSLQADISEAKELFDEANCVKCHHTNSFKVREDKINSFTKLYSIVDRCEFNNETGWFDDEKMDVVLYLNQDFYHFKKLDLEK